MPSATDSPLLCYITDRKAFPVKSAIADVFASIRRAIEAGVDWVQIREKDLSGRELSWLVRKAIEAAAERGSRTRILVNDRLDVAIAAGAAGVHLGGESLPVREAANWIAERRKERRAAANFLVGASCHGLEETLAAERDGASYVVFGPVFETPSKARFGPPLGTAPLREACGRARIPVLAVGGVNAANAGECFQAGAAGIAAIRLFQEAPSAGELRAAIDSLRPRAAR